MQRWYVRKPMPTAFSITAVVRRAKDGDIVNQVLERVAGQTVLKQIMRFQAAANRTLQDASPAQERHRPADLGLFNRGFCERHPPDPVTCRCKSDT